jgi:hypothetical protein
MTSWGGRLRVLGLFLPGGRGSMGALGKLRGAGISWVVSQTSLVVKSCHLCRGRSGVRWYFRDISDDPSEKELTQQDQFNNDEVALAEALVRETIQNSTDAQASPQVRVHFAIRTVEPDSHREFFRQIIGSLKPHLNACGIAEPSQKEPVRVLVVEDFGTTGLTGSVETKDNGQFSGFWRRFGRSNKEASKGGRWGLGKLVFPSASAVRVVLGLTQRRDETQAWLMGQAVLRNHSINGREKDSVGFWCRDKTERKGVPTDNTKLCTSISNAAGLARIGEPGLSIVVPYLLPEISKQHLLEATIRNYYFPILTGRLSVIINDSTIDTNTFDQIAASLPGGVSRSVLDFVRELHRSREDEPQLTLPSAWQAGQISGELLGVDCATNLRDKFKDGQLITIRAPLSVREKGGKVTHTHVDLFLKGVRPGEKGQTLVVRGAITVPTEGKKIGLPDCHAALVATDEPISRLLGDAENPAHTQWNERAEKLRAGWQGGHSVLRRVRAALPEIYQVVAERMEREDPLALLEFFSIPKTNRVSAAAKDSGGRPAKLPPPQLKPFRIEKRAGGFAILPGPGMQGVLFPLRLRIRCAYDVLTGNPFRRFSDYDFSFFRGGLKIDKTNADCWPKEPNEADIQAYKPDFKVEVFGFDKNRDLIIEAQD